MAAEKGLLGSSRVTWGGIAMGTAGGAAIGFQQGGWLGAANRRRCGIPGWDRGKDCWRRVSRERGETIVRSACANSRTNIVKSFSIAQDNNARSNRIDQCASTSDASDLVSIRLSETSWREPVAFGDVYTALVLWKRLGLGELLSERLDGSAAKVPGPGVPARIAVNRLVEPMPEWPMVRWWQRTALPQLLGIPVAAINDDRLYRCLDLVLPHKQAIEERIAGVGQSLFGQSYRYLLYDLTSTYFEGQMESNPKALRGYSRDHRPDCKQVTIGAVVDREGYPVGYEVLAGNVRDHKTVAGMLQRLAARFGLTDRTLC